MKVSAGGRVETRVQKGEGQQMKCNMIGESNEVNILLNGEIMNALLDSGSMITTLSETRYNLLLDKPELK